MGKAVESVLVSSQLPRGVLNVSLNPSQGTYTFDPVTKVHRCFRSQKSVAKKQHVLTEGKLTCPYNFEYFDIHRVNYRNLFFKLKLIGTPLLIYREPLGTKYAADIEHWAISRCRCCPGMLERSTHRNFPVWKAPWVCRPEPRNLTKTPPLISSSRSSRWPSQVHTPALLTRCTGTLRPPDGAKRCLVDIGSLHSLNWFLWQHCPPQGWRWTDWTCTARNTNLSKASSTWPRLESSRSGRKATMLRQ